MIPPVTLPGPRVVGIVGLGLMGGAIALTLRERGLLPPLGRGGKDAGPGNRADPGVKAGAEAGSPAGKGGLVRLLACDLDAASLEAARAEGVIDAGFRSPAEMLGQCDLVFLCLSPGTLLRFMDTWMAAFRPGALLTDIAGIKGPIAAAMEATLREDLDFIPAHPMAGKELRPGGAANFTESRRCDFSGKNYILTPLRRNRPENLAFLRDLILRMGFGRITETTPAEHDRNIAFTSQLCHVIAAALIDCEGDPGITRFGGGSFEDLTRIAMLNAPLWTELFLENRRDLLEQIDRFQGSLEALRGLIAGGQGEELEKRLGKVRDRRAAMG